MIKVSLVGTGTVSNHLKQVFSKTNHVEVTQMLPSRKEALAKALEKVQQEGKKEYRNELADIYIIAVSDDAIPTVSKQLTKVNRLVVHTSGSVAIDALSDENRRGVFYPLQTFSKGRKVDFKTIPICIEAKSKEDLELLRKLAGRISDSVHEITSEQRKSLHLGAVFVNNFANHVYQIGSEICKENEVPFDILKPLIKETVEKINCLSPFDAQSGPAKRNDQETIERHLNQLKNKTHQKVYQILTESIKETYGEKL